MVNATARRQAPDFSGYPDLVVMYLGMRVRTVFGIKTLLGFGQKIAAAGAARPEGLLHYENAIVFGFFPFHIGMRWYWRDIDALEAWAKSDPHRIWWKEYMSSSGGTAFWHETYHMRGGMEAIYIDVTTPVGFGGFMPLQPARGSMVGRHRKHAASDLSDLPADNPVDA